MSIIRAKHLEELRSWLNTQQAAQRLGLSRQGAINLAKDGRVRAVHLGASGGERGYWIFDPDSVESFQRQSVVRRARIASKGLRDGV